MRLLLPGLPDGFKRLITQVSGEDQVRRKRLRAVADLHFRFPLIMLHPGKKTTWKLSKKRVTQGDTKLVLFV